MTVLEEPKNENQAQCIVQVVQLWQEQGQIPGTPLSIVVMTSFLMKIGAHLLVAVWDMLSSLTQDFNIMPVCMVPSTLASYTEQTTREEDNLMAFPLRHSIYSMF